MTDEIRVLLEQAAPGRVAPLDLTRAHRSARRRSRVRTGTATLSTLAVTGVVAAAAIGWPSPSGVTVDLGPAATGPGCVATETGPITDTRHWDPATAPPAAAMYDEPLPSGGPHLAAVAPVPDSMPDAPLDVRAVVHNLEHGAIAVWIDPTKVDDATINEIETWASELNHAGFASPSGAGVLISPTPADAEVAAVSMRAWGQALDCAGWDPETANAFVAAHYGSRGASPEAILAPYPNPDPLATE